MAVDTVGKLSSEYLDELEKTSKIGNKRRDKLGQDEFLMLLMAQMTHQDPLEPMQDTQFIAQLAQFSSLEQMNALNSTMSMSHAYSMIGKKVSFLDSLTGDAQMGTVSSVFSQNGEPCLQVGDYVLKLSDIQSVYDNALFDLDKAFGLVGKYVTFGEKNTSAGADGKPVTTTTEYSGRVVSAYMKDNVPYLKIEGTDSAGAAFTKEAPYDEITAVSAPPDESGKTADAINNLAATILAGRQTEQEPAGTDEG